MLQYMDLDNDDIKGALDVSRYRHACLLLR